MLKRMRKIAVALTTVAIMVTVGNLAMKPTTAYAAETSSELIGGELLGSLDLDLESKSLSSYDVPEGYGVVRVTCATYGPGGKVFRYMDYQGEIGDAVKADLMPWSKYTHDELPENLVFAAEPQEIVINYYEISVQRRKNSGGSSYKAASSDDRPTIGEPPIASGSNADPDREDPNPGSDTDGDGKTDIGQPPVKDDPTYEITEEWWISQGTDGSSTEERISYTPQPDGTVKVESTKIVHHPDGRTDTMHTEKVQYPDGREEFVSGDCMTELPPIKPISGVPMRVDGDGRFYIEVGGERHYFGDEPEEEIGETEVSEIIHIPGVPGSIPDDQDEKSDDQTPDTETDASHDTPIDTNPIDLGEITPIPGVPMRVDEDGNEYVETGNHYYVGSDDPDADTTETGNDPDKESDEDSDDAPEVPDNANQSAGSAGQQEIGFADSPDRTGFAGDKTGSHHGGL